jgi:hypothetical protein
MTTDDRSDEYVNPMIRVVIMLLGLMVLSWLSIYHTGEPFPKDPKLALIFQNALLLVVLGSSILEPYFTKPADSMVNTLMASITMLGVYIATDDIFWWLIFIYCVSTFCISFICVSTSGNRENRLLNFVNRFTYNPAIYLGKARLIFSVVFLYGILEYYSNQSDLILKLIIFWGVYLALWPLKIPQLLSSLFKTRDKSKNSIGSILRVDSPGLIRLKIKDEEVWRKKEPMIYCRTTDQITVLPLYSYFNGGNSIGTALLVGNSCRRESKYSEGGIYTPDEPITHEQLMSMVGEANTAKLVGLVADGSSIGKLRIEVLSADDYVEGMLLWTYVGESKVYYQVVAGLTTEESISVDRHGYQIAHAMQIGVFDDNSFEKFDWLPNMNAPVFTSSDTEHVDIETSISDSCFVYGEVPKTNVPISGNFVKNYKYHTAVLGVTGSGKTELAFDMIRHSVQSGLKVICIDLTSQYSGRLGDLNPIDLTITDATSLEISDKLFEVETGNYGAGAEKKALKDYAETIRNEVRESLSDFVEQSESLLGLIQLPEISNTQASIFITEIYMSCLLNIAKDKYSDKSDFNVLVVVEEAHTVMPESATMGVSDFASKGLIAKIAQIALQGRKYNVGLMVLAQRTANVSKTVLTQCNSIISFACYDDTTLGFLKNMFGSSVAEMVPNLKKLQAIVYGKIVNSERPVVAEIPFDENKV